MADIVLTEKSPLDGRDVSRAGCRIRELPSASLYSLAIPLGDDAAFEAGLKQKLRVDMPDARNARLTETIVAMRLAPDQVMVLDLDGSDLRAAVGDLSVFAYVTEQTGSWCVIELSGVGVQAVLERLCPIDTAPDAFPVGAFARTVMEHMGAIILRKDPKTFILMSASSSAQSFWHALDVTLGYLDAPE